MKTETLKARVTSDLRAQILAIAAARGESESVIVREALRSYLLANQPSHYAMRDEPLQKPLPKPKPTRYV